VPKPPIITVAPSRTSARAAAVLSTILSIIVSLPRKLASIYQTAPDPAWLCGIARPRWAGAPDVARRPRACEMTAEWLAESFVRAGNA
jgi:hypothetical protein